MFFYQFDCCIHELAIFSLQQWDSRNGASLVTYDYSPKEDTILCISISKNGNRLVASATSGLVIVCTYGSGHSGLTPFYKLLVFYEVPSLYNS